MTFPEPSSKALRGSHNVTGMTSFTRVLGSSGIEASALGMGCWAIGGPWSFNGAPAGWSVVDDDESLRALNRAFDLGITFFDTAANYGAGRSERLLGTAFGRRREHVVIATKFGYQVDEDSQSVVSYDGDEVNSDVAGRLRDDLQASLHRLDTDYVDVYQLHVGGLSIDRALEARDVLEELVTEGLIRTYGWSTDRADAVRAFSTLPGCGVVQQGLSVLDDADPELLEICEELDLASINRGPLGMGLLTGKFSPTSTFATDDQRHRASGTLDSATASRPLSGSASWTRSVPCSPRRDGRWPRGLSPGSGHAASGPCRSPASRPWPRSRRTAAPSPPDR